MGLKINKALKKLGSVLDPIGVAAHKKAGVAYGDPANFGGQLDASMAPPTVGESSVARDNAALGSLTDLRRRRIARRQAL